MNLSEKLYNHNNKIIIALDGPSASGKGLISSMLAREFNLVCIESSIVYRGLAHICMEEKISSDDTDNVIKLSSNTDIISRVKGVDLSLEAIASMASKISVLSKVRTNLGHYLKQFIANTSRIVMEGRDIGTVIAPNADLKIFITADVKIRAQRRHKELRARGKLCMLNDMLNKLKERDERDQLRSVAPLKPANDAFLIDTTSLTPLDVIHNIKNFVSK